MPYARQKRQYKYMLGELQIPLEFIFSFNTIFQKRCTLCVMSELEHASAKMFCVPYAFGKNRHTYPDPLCVARHCL